MSNEVILNLSFDNQTVTDLTGKWVLDGTPNATYEQIDGRDGYSIVTGSLGRCIVLNAVDQNTVYNEYTVDFDMFVKSTYTSNYYFYKIMYMWSLINPGNEYSGKIGNVLNVSLEIGGSEPVRTTNYSPIGRWVHVTFTSGPTEVDYQYCTTVYVDGVKLLDRTDTDVRNNPFALSQQIMLFTRDADAKLMPNGPGICLNTFKVVTGIHMPDQNPAISLFNLSRVFNNFCTWLKGQLSTVALTGSYNDLSDKPTISTVNDATLTIQQNGTNVQTFTANASTNKTANIQCVDLSTIQTIGGTKTFRNNLYVYNSDNTTNTPNLYLKSSKIEMSSQGNTSGEQNLIYLDKNSITYAYAKGAIQSYSTAIKIGAIAKDNSNNLVKSELQVLAYPNGGKAVIPTYTNETDLGVSNFKWKSFNGLNPGALSLPGTFVNVDTTNWVLDGTPNIFTPTSDGWLGIQVTDTVYDQMHYVFVGRTGGGGTYYPQNLMSPISALWDNTYHGSIFIPVIKDMQYHIRCICNNIVAKFYPCQGNV